MQLYRTVIVCLLLDAVRDDILQIIYALVYLYHTYVNLYVTFTLGGQTLI